MTSLFDQYKNTEEVQRKPISQMSYKEMHQELKRKNPKIHLGHTMNLVKMWNVDPRNKEHYYNAMAKAGEDPRCQIKNHEMKYSQINALDEKTKLSTAEGLQLVLAQLPKQFQKKMKYSNQSVSKKEKPKIVDDGFITS